GLEIKENGKGLEESHNELNSKFEDEKGKPSL
ncbi:unnamed protein product, partial [marine sediment metagenome]